MAYQRKNSQQGICVEGGIARVLTRKHADFAGCSDDEEFSTETSYLAHGFHWVNNERVSAHPGENVFFLKSDESQIEKRMDSLKQSCCPRNS